MSSLSFRHVDASPEDPVETWPVEAMQVAVARGGLGDWRRVLAAVAADPWGPVSRTLEHVLTYERPYGTGELLDRAVTRIRARAERVDREEVARRIATAVTVSGLTQTEFAERLGTSQSRLSTYISGRVTPSAALLVRSERLAARGQPAQVV